MKKIIILLCIFFMYAYSQASEKTESPKMDSVHLVVSEPWQVGEGTEQYHVLKMTAHKDNQEVGCAFCKYFPTTKICSLENITTYTAFRKKGIGTYLFKRAIAIAGNMWPDITHFEGIAEPCGSDFNTREKRAAAQPHLMKWYTKLGCTIVSIQKTERLISGTEIRLKYVPAKPEGKERKS